MIVLIPARGGSKGLPGKNVRMLGDMPLIAHSICAALSAELVTRVIVSTDDAEISAVATEYGAEVPFMRPPELAQDDSMVMDAYLYTIDRLAEQSGSKISEFTALLPTAPFRTHGDIDSAINIFREQNADSVISVTETEIPVQWYRKIDEEGILREYLPGFDAIQNRQHNKVTYVPNGAIYIFKTEVLRSSRKYYTNKTYPYIMPSCRSVDIDTELDFLYSEFLINKKK